MMEFGKQEENQWVLGNNILGDRQLHLPRSRGKQGRDRRKQRRINEGKARMITGMVEWRNTNNKQV